jgi:hypothetical protein
MNSSEQSPLVFEAAPVFGCEPGRPAHSGPELIPLLPNPSVGLELARALLTDAVQVSHYSSPIASGILQSPDVVIRLSRQ